MNKQIKSTGKKDNFIGTSEKILNYFLRILKEEAIERLLVSVLKKSVGLKAWLITFLAEKLFEEVVEPAAHRGLRRLKYEYIRHDGTVILKKIEEAKKDENQTDYDSAIDDIFN